MIYKILFFILGLFLILLAYNWGLKVGFKSRETFDVALITSIAKHQAECIKVGDEICVVKSNEIILNSLNLISEDLPLESLQLQMPESNEPIK